jgi:hypothetical protein
MMNSGLVNAPFIVKLIARAPARRFLEAFKEFLAKKPVKAPRKRAR